DDLKTRLFGNKMYVDVEIAAKGELTLEASHEIAEAVHIRIEEVFPDETDKSLGAMLTVKAQPTLYIKKT
ncbi:MAG: hypothetical protein IIY69_06335, partial [Clostridia bacterium]|nr:hypothetical protein [Clostridia bacterium]